MPDLGKAVYTLILSSGAFDANLARSEARATAATNKMAAGFERQGAAAVAAGEASQAGATATVTAAERSAAAVNASANSQASAWGRASAAMDKNHAKMRSTGRALTRTLTMPVAAVGVAAGVMAFKFNESMHHIESLVGASDKQMKEYTAGIEEMTGAVGKSPKELSEALYFVTSSGFESAAALRVLEASAKASAAGLGQTLTVADAVTSAVNAYSEKVLSATAATDVLTAAVREGKVEPEEFAASIGRVIPLAETMGVSFGEVGGIMAAMSLGGLDASEGATALRGSMAALVKPSKDGKKTLEAYGTSIEEVRAAVQEHGLFPVLKELRESMDISDLGKVFPNVRALTGVLNATGRGLKKNAGILEEVKNSAGDTDEAFGKVAKTNEFKLRQSFAKLSQQMVKLGNVFIPIAVKMMNAVLAITTAFNKLPGPVKTAIGAVILLAAALGPLVTGIWLVVKANRAMNAMMLLTSGNATKAAAGTGIFRASLVGKAGLYGAFVLVGYGIGQLLLKYTRLGETMEWLGGKAYDLAGALGLVDDSSLAVAGKAGGKGSMHDPEARLKAASLFAQTDPDMPGDVKDAIAKKVMGEGWTWHDVEITAAHPVQAQAVVGGSPMKTYGKGKGKGGPPGTGVLGLTPRTKGDAEDDKKKGKGKGGAGGVEPSITELPNALALKITRAERTKTLNDDLKFAREEEAFYRKRLKIRGLSSAKRLELEQALTGVLARERDLIEQGARDRDITTMPKHLKARLEKAKKTKDASDDLKVWQAEKKWLRARLKNKKLSLQERLSLQKELEKTNKKIEALKKKENAERERHHKRLMELQAVTEARGSFFADFAGNIFGVGPGGLTLDSGDRRGGVNKNLTVNQSNTYQEIPRDRHGHARHLQRAASASMDTM